MTKFLKLIIFSIFSGILTGFFLFFELKNQEVDPVFTYENSEKLATMEENALLPISDFSVNSLSFETVKKIKVVVTAYSSTPWETWGDPFITAAGTGVKEGIVANNLLPFGTRVRFPEIYGEKIFTVEDRMNSRKGYYHVDIWFPSYQEALNFGAKRTYIEVLEN